MVRSLSLANWLCNNGHQILKVEDSEKDSEKDSSEVTEKEDDTNETQTNTNTKPPVIPTDEVGTGEFMTVYNNETGVYEIVSVAKYLTEDAYVSENHTMGIKDLSKEISSGYAVSKVDVNQERGLIMYIIPICIIFGIAGAIVIYVKRKERRA